MPPVPGGWPPSQCRATPGGGATLPTYRCASKYEPQQEGREPPGHRVGRVRAAAIAAVQALQSKAPGSCPARRPECGECEKECVGAALERLRFLSGLAQPPRQVRTDFWLTHYLAAELDCHSRRCVGWSIADHLRAELVADACEMAIQRRRPEPGLVHHSDHLSETPMPAELDEKAVVEYPAPRACPACGREVSGRRKWCSEACRKRAWRRQ